MISKLFKAAAVLFLVFIMSCQKGQDEVLDSVNDENLSTDISIDQAKKWFLSAYSGARMNGSNIKSKAFFKYATEYRFTKRDKQKYIILPLFHKSTQFQSNSNGFKQLWIYKNVNKENQGFLIKLGK